MSDGSNVYIVGDSLTVGSTTAIKSKLPKAEINGLVSSWFSKGSAGLPSGIERAKNIGNQSILVFAMGTNGGISQSDIDKLVTFVDEHSSIKQVILMTIYYNTAVSRYSGTSNQMTSSNSLVKATANARSNFSYFDWYSAVSNDPTTYISTDGVHPTSAGKEKFAELITSAIDRAPTSAPLASSTGAVATMFSSSYELGDAIVREFCSIDKSGNRTLGSGLLKLSIVNYAPLVEGIAEANGLYLQSGLSGNVNVDTSNLSGNCKIVVDLLIAKGLNGAAACGIAGNIYHESGFRTDAVGDHGTSFGICQWHNSRGTNMKNFVGSNWKTNLSGQVDFLWHELSTSYTSVLNYLRSTPNTLEGCKSAADYFVRNFEKPSDVNNASIKRQSTAAEYFNQLIVVTASPTSAVVGSLTSYSGNTLTLVNTVQVPENIQTGLISNYTNYTYFFKKWSWTQRKIADAWAAKGKTSSKGIATIDGHYLIAMSSKFGTTGDLVVIHLANGESFSAILADSKGSDATSPWGHVMGTGKVDIIEWEAIGSDSSASKGTNIQLGSWLNVKVTSVDNYGQWI